MPIKPLHIDLIKMDAGTQARVEINPQWVDEFAERLQEGEELPPVVVFVDGVRHYLADGFHRVLARIKLGFKSVKAEIKAGTLDEAVWYSLGANARHGHPMTTADKEKAVKTALVKFPKRSDRDIAKQVGVSNHFVGKHRKEAESGGNIPTCDSRTGADGKTYPAHPSASISPDEIPYDAPAEAGDGGAAPAGGNGAESAAGSQSPPTPEPFKDKVGNVITDPAVIAAFKRRGELTAMIQSIGHVLETVKKAAESGDPLYAGVSLLHVQADCHNIQGELRDAQPYALCPYCDGRGCKGCLNRGWVSKHQYSIAPKDRGQAEGSMADDDDG